MKVDSASQTQRAAALMEQGFTFLREGNITQAIKVGAALKKLRHSAAFEILALAHLQRNHAGKAIRVLEDGVRKASSVWILWKLLGDCFSYAGRFSEAEAAYRAALQRNSCDPSLIHLNRAISFLRNERTVEAAAAIAKVPPNILRRRADAVRIRVSLAQGKSAEARRLAHGLCRIRPKGTDLCDTNTESEIALACALAFKGFSTDRKRALTWARNAVECAPSNTEALTCLRELNGRECSLPGIYRLTIHGNWPGKSSETEAATDKEVPLGFYRTVDVAAVTKADAFRQAKAFFPQSIRKSLVLEDSVFKLRKDVTREGVYRLSGYILYKA